MTDEVPPTLKSERIPVDRITVKQRVRGDMGDLETLTNSIREYGLINPILVDPQYQLIAGERRLRAVQSLGWPEIDVRILDGVSRIALFDMEVHENLLRKNFSENEIAKSIETKKRLLNPPWYTRVRDWFARLKLRWFRPHS